MRNEFMSLPTHPSTEEFEQLMPLGNEESVSFGSMRGSLDSRGWLIRSSTTQT